MTSFLNKPFLSRCIYLKNGKIVCGSGVGAHHSLRVVAQRVLQPRELGVAIGNVRGLAVCQGGDHVAQRQVDLGGLFFFFFFFSVISLFNTWSNSCEWAKSTTILFLFFSVISFFNTWSNSCERFTTIRPCVEEWGDWEEECRGVGSLATVRPCVEERDDWEEESRVDAPEVWNGTDWLEAEPKRACFEEKFWQPNQVTFWSTMT